MHVYLSKLCDLALAIFTTVPEVCMCVCVCVCVCMHISMRASINMCTHMYACVFEQIALSSIDYTYKGTWDVYVCRCMHT